MTIEQTMADWQKWIAEHNLKLLKGAKKMNALVTMLDGETYIIDDFDRLCEALEESQKNGCHFLFRNEGVLPVRQICHIRAIPCEDVVAVVRCKDCKYCYVLGDHTMPSCNRDYPHHHVNFDDYCAFGERKEEQ